MKSRLITVFTSILLLLTFIFSPSAPLITSYKVFAEGYLSPLEELRGSEGFDEASLLLKTDITVIDMVEYWKDSSTQCPALFVYVYNPTTKKLKDSTDDKIRIRVSNDDHWESYSLDYIQSTDDGKYVKYLVEKSDILYSLHKDNTKRYYDVSDIHLVCDNDTTPSSFIVGFKYWFSGSGKGDFNVEKEKYDVIKVEELVPMVYRDIKPDVWDYPNGQINSVMFSLPKTILEEYGAVSEIYLEYYKYRTSPIVVSDDQTPIHEGRKDWVGRDVGSDGIDSANPLCLTWGDYIGIDSPLDPDTLHDKYYHDYGYNKYFYTALGYPSPLPFEYKKTYNKLSYSFSSGSKNALKYDVSSDELEDWIYGYAEEYLQGQEYETLPVKDDKLPAELFVDMSNTSGYGKIDKSIKVGTQKFNVTVKSNWWEIFSPLFKTIAQDYETVQTIDVSGLGAGGDAVLADKYKINESYVGDLKAFAAAKTLANEQAFVFHFDVSDYYASPARVWGKYQGPIGGTGITSIYPSQHVYVAQTDVYLNLSFIDFTFVKDDVATVLAVSSDVIDFFPPIQHPGSTGCADFDLSRMLRIVFGTFLIIVLVVLLWNPIISLFKLIFAGKDKPKRKNSKKSNRRRKK
ncbi:MAG: hypothetical protein J6C23_03275 [Clostridia bacterium]|nr:hypothetical protein [Clostridia bacterium]